MTQVLVGGVILLALYWLPGFVLLRRTKLGVITRIVIATAITYAIVTAALIVLGAADVLGRPAIIAVWIALIVVAIAVPVPATWLAQDNALLRGPLLTATGFGVLLLVQGLRPGIFRTNDALSVWAPLALDIGNTGTIDPDWLPTMVEGFPPSVALIAGSVSRVAGGFSEVHAFIVHPLYTTLLLMTAVLLGGWLGGRWAGWLTLVTVLSTPLLFRGLVFHDDLLAAFLTAAAVLLALRAITPVSWTLVGIVAGGAFAVKHLGVVAALLVGVILVTRLPPSQAWFAAAAGWLIGLPWYVWNVFRFGNPVHPLLPGVFGEPDAVVRVVADATAALRFEDRAILSDVGALALALLGIGVIAALRSAASPERRRLVVGLVVAIAALVVTWQLTGYRTRHLMQVIPITAAVGSAGLVALAPKKMARPAWGAALVVAAAALLLIVTSWDVQRDYWGRDEPDVVAQTGVYTVLQGKWRNLRLAVSPPDDDLDLFVGIRHAWDELAHEPVEPLVFSFDLRQYYIPQRILSAVDTAALPVYDASDAEGRHAALVEAGVGFVLDNRDRGPRHRLFFGVGPWKDVRERPDLYREMSRGSGIRLYEVIVQP